MIVFAIGSLLFGALLGMYFRALVLAPAILLAVAAVTATGIAGGEGAKTLFLTMVVVAACLQAGYIAGCILRHMVSAPRVGNREGAISTSGLSKPF
jgi:hypothetical protein